MGREFDVVIERDEDGYYVGSVPALPGCHTQARSLDELIGRVREAIASAWRPSPRPARPWISSGSSVCACRMSGKRPTVTGTKSDLADQRGREPFQKDSRPEWHFLRL